MLTTIMEQPGTITLLTILVGVLMVYVADKALRIGKPPAMFRWAIPMFYTFGGAFLVIGIMRVVDYFKG